MWLGSYTTCYSVLCYSVQYVLTLVPGNVSLCQFPVIEFLCRWFIIYPASPLLTDIQVEVSVYFEIEKNDSSEYLEMFTFEFSC